MMERQPIDESAVDENAASRRPNRPAFRHRTWFWCVVPIVIAAAIATAVVCCSEREADSPFLYDNF